MQHRIPIRFLKIDVIIQRIFLVLIVVCLLIFPIAMLLAIPFGAWQVLSGFVGGIYGSKWRWKYLGVVAVYFCCYPLGMYIADVGGGSEVVEFALGTFFILTPIILGFTYYIKSEKELPKTDKQVTKDEDESILDAEMTYESST